MIAFVDNMAKIIRYGNLIKGFGEIVPSLSLRNSNNIGLQRTPTDGMACPSGKCATGLFCKKKRKKKCREMSAHEKNIFFVFWEFF